MRRAGTCVGALLVLLMNTEEAVGATLLVVLTLEAPAENLGADRDTSRAVALSLATPRSTAVGVPIQLPALSTNCAPAVPFAKPCGGHRVSRHRGYAMCPASPRRLDLQGCS